MVGQRDLLDELIRRARAGQRGGRALKALDDTGGDGGEALGEGHRGRDRAQALDGLGEHGGRGRAQLHAGEILGLRDVAVGDDGAEAEGIMRIQDVDILLRQAGDDVRNDIGGHDVVVFVVAAVEHRADQHGGVADVVREQGGLLKAHPQRAVGRLRDGIAVAVELILAIIGDRDMALGPLGDHVGQLLRGLVVPLRRLEHVRELDLEIEIVGVFLRHADA